MPTTYKEVQVQGTAGVGTYATLYSTDASTTAILGTIGICNTSSSPATYRIGVMDSAGTPSGAEWRVYDSVVAASDTVFLTVGMTVGPSKFLRVSSSATTVTFFASVAETE